MNKKKKPKKKGSLSQIKKNIRKEILVGKGALERISKRIGRWT